MHKSLRAVNRVDNPLVFRIGALDSELLANHAKARSLLGPEFTGQFFRTLVGNRHRSVVLFPLDTHSRLEILQDIFLGHFRCLERDL